MYMEFEWDAHNQEKNKIKHGVEYYEAEEMFVNSPIVVLQDITHSQKEDRYIAYGMSDKGRLLAAVYTYRESKIRIISVRDQNKKERTYYTLHHKDNEE